jgi:hypothetical protein
MNDHRLLSYTSPCLSPYSSPLIMSPLHLAIGDPDVKEMKDLNEPNPKHYERYLEQLIKFAKRYQLPHTYIHSFVCDVTDQQYNDFLKHYSLRKKLTAHDNVLSYIIHKINVLTGDRQISFINEIIWAIDDYMYMLKHGISYEELKTIRQPHYRPYDSEIIKIVAGLETYHIDLNGQKIGLYERKNSAGIVIETGTYKDDLKEGLFEYCNNGRTQMGSYRKDKKIGRWVTYFENGVMARCGWYKDNVPDGIWSFYDRNGTLIKEGSYVMGKKEGIWKKDIKKEYYLNGILLNCIS